VQAAAHNLQQSVASEDGDYGFIDSGKTGWKGVYAFTLAAYVSGVEAASDGGIGGSLHDCPAVGE
jgi:hypothetical protein